MREEILGQLAAEKTRIGEFFKRKGNQTVIDYTREMTSYESPFNANVINDRETVAGGIADNLEGRANPDQVMEIVDQYKKRPIIQTGDHCELLYNPETFLNNFVYQMGMRQVDAQYLLTQQCSTVRMIQGRNPLRGPAFVELEGGLYRVFDKSKKKLTRSNVATLSNVDFTFKPEGADPTASLPSLLTDLQGMSFHSAADAFLYANKYTWERIHFEDKKDLILFDESLSSDVLIHLLENSDHPLNTLLFDERALAVFKDEIHAFVASDECLILNDISDFFYGKHGDELIGLKLTDDFSTLVGSDSNRSFRTAYTREAIINSLKNRTLYPNLMLSMLALSIFPQSRVLGGSSQVEYIPEIQAVLRRTCIRLDLLPNDYISAIAYPQINPTLSVIARSPQLKHAIQRMDKDTDFTQWEQEIGSLTIDASMGDYGHLAYFDSYFQRRKARKG